MTNDITPVTPTPVTKVDTENKTASLINAEMFATKQDLQDMEKRITDKMNPVIVPVETEDDSDFP